MDRQQLTRKKSLKNPTDEYGVCEYNMQNVLNKMFQRPLVSENN